VRQPPRPGGACPPTDQGDAVRTGSSAKGARDRASQVHAAAALDHMNALDEAIARIDKEVEANVEPFRTAIQILSTVPGIGQLSARSSSPRSASTWAASEPRSSDLLGRPLSKNDESAGKRRSTRMRKGAPWLKTMLIQCAWAAARPREAICRLNSIVCDPGAGQKKAIGAVAASILTAAYHMLKNGTLYQDLGADYFDGRAKANQAQRLVGRLQNLGFAVQITPLHMPA